MMSTPRGNSYSVDDSCHGPRITSTEFGNAKVELSPGQKVELKMSPMRKTGFHSYLGVAPVSHRKPVDRIEVARPADVDWLSGVAKSLKREAEDLKHRNEKLESQISLAQDSSISINGCFGNLSGLSTAPGASQSAIGFSQGLPWSQLSVPTEDRFSEERRTLRARVSTLEEEQRRLEMAKIRRLANIGGKATSSSAEPPSAVTTLQELDLLTKQVDEVMVACTHMERLATEKENALVRIRSEVQECVRFDSSEGPRFAAEARCLRENLQSNRFDQGTANQKMREAEVASTRALTSANTMKSDCKILTGTRDALILEEVTVRERLAAISRSRLQTNLAVAELRESHASSIDHAKAVILESIRNTEVLEESGKDAHTKLSQICADCLDLPRLRKDLDDLSHTHSELSKHEGHEMRYRKLQTVGAECEAAATINREGRARLTVALNSLQDLRSSYAARLQVLKETAAAHSVEHARFPDVSANLKRICIEMITHAEALACRLKEERAYGDTLWKEISAISEAARLARNHPMPRRSRAVRGRENLDPASNLALNAGAGSAAAWSTGRKRSVAR